MRLALCLVLLLALGTVLSCADMPVAPKSLVTLEGTVLDRDGGPLHGARLYFSDATQTQGSPYSPPPPLVGSATTGTDGTFTIQLPEGEYFVVIYPPGDTGTGFPAVSIPHFKVSGKGARLDYRYSGIYVSGRIIGPNGATPPLAYVTAFPYDGYTFAATQSKDAMYRLLLASGRYHFNAEAGSPESGLPQLAFDANIPPQDTTIDLDFSGYEIKVTVSLQGTPLVGAEVTASREGIRADAETDIGGSATLFLPAGGYSFVVSPNADGITGPEEMYQLIQGDGTVPFNLTGVTWNVTLRRQADLSPIPQASVDVAEIGGQRYGHAQSDGQGKWRMIVQPNRGHDVKITLPYPVSGSYPTIIVNGVSSSADSTFDLVIDAPLP